jgi:hypothetical protein
MQQQITESFHRAFIERIKEAINNREYYYIVNLLEEILQRLCSLIPRRIDIHQNLAREIDLVLIRQMLENNAFGNQEFEQIMNTFFRTISWLQAPIDRAELEEVKGEFNSLDGTISWAESVAPFFLKINKLIDRIEQRRDALV